MNDISNSIISKLIDFDIQKYSVKCMFFSQTSSIPFFCENIKSLKGSAKPMTFDTQMPGSPKERLFDEY